MLGLGIARRRLHSPQALHTAGSEPSYNEYQIFAVAFFDLILHDARFDTMRDDLMQIHFKQWHATSAFMPGLLVMFCFTLPSRSIYADTVLLRNGCLVEGRCLNTADKDAKEFQIETDSGLLLTLSRAEVKDLRPTSAEQKQYAEALAKKEDSLDVHRKFVEACVKLGILPLADAHRERIVELDPSDKTAWAALGYLDSSEGWIRRDLFQKRRGLQQQGKRWYIPQDLAIQQANEQAKKNSARVSREVAKAIADVRSKNANAAKSLQLLNELRDPLAVPKLSEAMVNDRGNSNPQFRFLMVEILSHIRSSEAVDTLIESAIVDPDRNLRTECVAHLAEFGREAAIQSFLRRLINDRPEKDDAEIYNRVGEALATIGDERCIPKLLDCLVTNHLVVPPTQPTYRAGTTSDGNIQATQGQKKPEKVQRRNEGVLSALLTICQGENFGFDVQRWRNWYASQYAAPNPYVLRDP